MRRLPSGAPILTAARMRAAEQAAFDRGVSQFALMERAGAAVAREVARLSSGRPILVLAGPGNNGGDAYAAAAVLRDAGHDVAVAALGSPKDGAAATMAARWDAPIVSLNDAPPRPIVVDGLLGIGTPRPFEDDVARAIDAVLRPADLRIAIDLPSGVDCDTGLGGIAVDVTIALGAVKPAHVLADGAANSGHVLLADIGLTVSSDCTTIAPPALAPLRHDVNKFTRGMVVVVAGAMPGAGWLAATAALRGGAGYVVLAGLNPAGGAPHAVIRHRLSSASALDAVLDDDRIGAVVVGPGLGRDASARDLLDCALASRHVLVVDGDALTLLGRDAAARVRARRTSTYLTPHAGEFARMFDTAGGKIAATVRAAAESGATIAHKGPDTVIAGPDGRAIVAGAASPWLATAGSGDVLAGVVAARLAAGGPSIQSVSDAVWLHARAAQTAGAGFTADDLVGHVAGALAQCLPN